MKAWNSINQRKALAAVNELTDQAELAHAAKKAWRWKAREAAVKKLTDWGVLIDIAKGKAIRYHKVETYKKTDYREVTVSGCTGCGANVGGSGGCQMCPDTVKTVIETKTRWVIHTYDLRDTARERLSELKKRPKKKKRP